MAVTIKGINLVIGAETTGLQKSLSDVNKKSKDLQSELKQVEKLLKLDPKNTELLAQKQKLLGEAVENSKEKLDRLRKAQEQVNEQFRKGEISEEQYRAFQREVAKAEQELSKLEGQLKQTGGTAQKTGIDFEKLGNNIKGVGEKMKGIGTTMSAAVTAPIVGGFVALTQGTKEFRGDLARLEANAETAGQEMGVLRDAMATLNAVTGETDSSVEGLSNLLATGFRDEQLTELLDSLYGASIKFADTLKFEGISDGLQETLATGAAIGPFAELLERSGIVLDTFNEGLTAAIENGREEEYILEVLAGTGLAGTYEAWKKQNEEMVKAEEANYRMQEAMAQLGATLEPILTPIIEKITELVSKFNEMDPGGQKVALVIAGIAAAIGPVLVVLGSLITVIGAISLPVVAAVAGILALGAGLVWIYDKWKENGEKSKQILEDLGKKVQETIAAVLNWFSELPGKIGEFMNQLPYKIGYALGLALGTLFQFGLDAINWAIIEVPNFIETVIKFIAELPGKIAEWLKKALEKVVEWGSNLISWAKKNLPTVISNIIRFFADLPKKLLDIGVEMVKGLWSGIQSMIGWIGEKIKGFVSGIVSGIKAGLDIQSPSRVMADIGKNISLGLAEGMIGAADAVDNAMNGLLGNMLLRADLAGAGTTNYNNGGNTINITVQDGEDLLRTLHRLGVTIP